MRQMQTVRSEEMFSLKGKKKSLCVCMCVCRGGGTNLSYLRCTANMKIYQRERRNKKEEESLQTKSENGGLLTAHGNKHQGLQFNSS